MDLAEERAMEPQGRPLPGNVGLNLLGLACPLEGRVGSSYHVILDQVPYFSQLTSPSKYSESMVAASSSVKDALSAR